MRTVLRQTSVGENIVSEMADGETSCQQKNHSAEKIVAKVSRLLAKNLSVVCIVGEMYLRDKSFGETSFDEVT